MTTNCEWFHARIEGYFTETLNNQELQECRTHLAACADCSRQIQELEEIDPLVRYSFQRRLATARLAAERGARPRVLRLALAGSTLIVAAALGIGVFLQQETPVPFTALNPSENVQPPAPVEIVTKKQVSSQDPKLGKPDEGIAPVPPLQNTLDSPVANAPEFAIIDSVGQANTLETYRGHVLLFAVVSSEQKEATANLQQVYEAFGSNPGVRILGVAERRDDTVKGATFPVFFNHGSKLMGVQKGQFMVVDTTGASRLTGSLSDASSPARIRTQLSQLGIK